MTIRSKKLIIPTDSVDDNDEFIPLSPITSPDPRKLKKRQEQNRAAQKAFRERRDQTVKEMEARLSRLEAVFEEFSKSITRINLVEKEFIKLKESVNNLHITIDSMAIPAWTVPLSDDLKSIVQVEPRPIGAVIGALRPSSTDPTLKSSNQ